MAILRSYYCNALSSTKFKIFKWKSSLVQSFCPPMIAFGITCYITTHLWPYWSIPFLTNTMRIFTFYTLWEVKAVIGQNWQLNLVPDWWPLLKASKNGANMTWEKLVCPGSVPFCCRIINLVIAESMPIAAAQTINATVWLNKQQLLLLEQSNLLLQLHYI